jgi:hypothetical protein
LTWIYQVTYPNGARETITDRVVKSDQIDSLRGTALVVSDYSGLDGSRAVRADLPTSYPDELTEVETSYVLEGGYVSHITSLGGASGIRFEEGSFLPEYLWPDRAWSSTLSPFGLGTLKINQNHQSFLEADEVVTPAGRFLGCIRIETEASYESPAGLGDKAGTSDKRFFTDWYAPDVGLVKTLVLSGAQDGREMTRIQLVRFAKSGTAAPEPGGSPHR